MPRKALPTVSRRTFLSTAAISGAATALTSTISVAGERAAKTVAYQPRPFELEELTISDLQEGLKSGKFTARSLVEKYWIRISDIDMRDDPGHPVLNSIIEMNPEALAVADKFDQERKSGKVRGPLHGIPILIKDNIATDDRMMTTAGSLALVGAKVAKDSGVVQ